MLGGVNPMAPRTADAVLLASRLLVAPLFLVSGWGKWMDLAGTAAGIESAGMPFGMLGAIAAGTLEIAAAAAIVAGVFVRPAAALLAGYSLLVAVLFHNFWGVADPSAAEGEQIHFLKNLGLAAACLLLTVTGPGRIALGVARAPVTGVAT